MTIHRIIPLCFIPVCFGVTLALGCTTKNGPGNGTDAGTTSNGGGTSGGSGGATGGGSSSGTGTSSPVQPFVGTWSVSTGTTTVNCPGQSPSTTADTADLTFSSPGGGSSLQVSSADCSFTAQAEGNVASESPSNQTCLVPYQGGSVLLTYSSYTFTLSAGETDATLSGDGTLKEMVSGGATYDCTFTESAQYVKN